MASCSWWFRIARRTLTKIARRQSIEHLVEDHESGSQLSRTAHYVEYAELANKKTGRDAYNHAADLESAR